MRTDDGRRVEQRVAVNQEFESFGTFVDAYVTNISRSGAFLKCPTPMPVGTKVALRFTVIGDEVETISGIGEVVRVQNDPSGMGVVFTDLDATSATAIETLLVQRRLR